MVGKMAEMMLILPYIVNNTGLKCEKSGDSVEKWGIDIQLVRIISIFAIDYI